MCVGEFRMAVRIFAVEIVPVLTCSLLLAHCFAGFAAKPAPATLSVGNARLKGCPAALAFHGDCFASHVRTPPPCLRRRWRRTARPRQRRQGCSATECGHRWAGTRPTSEEGSVGDEGGSTRKT